MTAWAHTCDGLATHVQGAEELFETVSQCLLSGMDRDALSGWGAVVYVMCAHVPPCIAMGMLLASQRGLPEDAVGCLASIAFTSGVSRLSDHDSCAAAEPRTRSLQGRSRGAWTDGQRNSQNVSLPVL